MINKQELEKAIRGAEEIKKGLLANIEFMSNIIDVMKKLAAKADEPKQKGWRQKPHYNDSYWCIFHNGKFVRAMWTDTEEDELRYATGNCFPCNLFTEEQVQQIAWQNQLNSLLYQYAIINGALASEEEKKDDAIPLYWAEEECDGEFSIVPLYSQTPLVAKFNKGDVASRAFEDVIKPFCEAHPEFVW